jgi:hypothetical protein
MNKLEKNDRAAKKLLKAMIKDGCTDLDWVLFFRDKVFHLQIKQEDIDE